MASIASASRIQVACAADAKYFPHCAAMVASLIAFNPKVQVHVLCDETVPEADRLQLSAWADQRGAGLVCTVPQADLPSITGSPRLSQAAWLRVLLPDLLRDHSRVIYLDVDMIVQDSLRELWDLELHGNLVAAVTNVPQWHFRPEVRQNLSMELYFNSGLLVMDLERLRAERLAEQAFQFARDRPHLVEHADQAPLNALLHARRQPLHLRWNVQSPVHEDEIGKPCPFSNEEIRQALQAPAIVHYSGPWKPWHFRCKHPLRHLYAKYRAQTPWPEWQLEGRTLKHRILRLLPSYLAKRLTELRTAVRLGLT